MDRRHDFRALQCEGAHVHSVGAKIIQDLHHPQIHSNSVGQHCLRSLRQPPRRPLSPSHRNSNSHMVRGLSPQDIPPSTPSGGQNEPHSGPFIASHSPQHLQLVPASRHISAPGSSLGSALVRSLRRYNEPSSPKIQFPVPRPLHIRSRCPRPAGLGAREQLRQPPLRSHPQGLTGAPVSAGIRHHHRPLVACSPLVRSPPENGGLSSHPSTQSKPVLVQGCTPRAPEKSPLEDIRLASLWKQALLDDGWSEQTASCAPHALAHSSHQSYDRYIKDLRAFCVSNGICFPPVKACQIAEFLLHVARKSDRPKSSLNGTMSALSSLYNIYDLPNPCNFHVHALYTALIKTHTKLPRARTNVMPTAPFHKLFESWKDNEELSVKMLRLKCITLIAFAFMLRPSDVAPKGVQYDSESDTFKPFLFLRSQISFPDDGGLRITFFAIKNDSSRDGFEVSVPRCDNAKLDPALALNVYLQKTQHLVTDVHAPAFISLKKPHQGISASAVGSVLSEAISLAGLSSSMYTPKCFRPSGATKAVNSGMDPDKVRRLGRWKTSSVFYEHYVYDKTSDKYTNMMFDV